MSARVVWLIEWRYRNEYGYPRGWQTYYSDAWASKAEATAEAKSYAPNWHRSKEWRVVPFNRRKP